MKNVMLVFALGMLISNTAFAEASVPGKNKNPLLTQTIKEMIGSPKVQDRLFKEENLTVKFTVNEEGEIVVIHTDSDRFDHYIKQRLNYQRINKDLTTPGKTYILPVTIVKS